MPYSARREHYPPGSHATVVAGPWQAVIVLGRADPPGAGPAATRSRVA